MLSHSEFEILLHKRPFVGLILSHEKHPRRGMGLSKWATTRAACAEGLLSQFSSCWTRGVGCVFMACVCLSKPTRSMNIHSNLVDSASSHTLVSKIKPCMSKYKRLYTVKLRTAH